MLGVRLCGILLLELAEMMMEFLGVSRHYKNRQYNA